MLHRHIKWPMHICFDDFSKKQVFVMLLRREKTTNLYSDETTVVSNGMDCKQAVNIMIFSEQWLFWTSMLSGKPNNVCKFYLFASLYFYGIFFFYYRPDGTREKLRNYFQCKHNLYCAVIIFCLNRRCYSTFIYIVP